MPTTLVPSLIRTLTMLIVGWLIAIPVVNAVGVTSDQLTTLVQLGVTGAYYLLVRLLERVNPAFGWLLGLAKQPAYAPKVNGAHVVTTMSATPQVTTEIWHEPETLFSATGALLLSFDKASYVSGDTVVGTYSGIALDPGTPDTTFTGTGSASINGGAPQAATASLVVKGRPADTIVYNPPTVPGLTFAPTANRAVFTALVP